jgi:hypothetical protein
MALADDDSARLRLVGMLRFSLWKKGLRIPPKGLH